MRGIEPRLSRADQMKTYEQYYLKQTGSGVPAFAGARYQRGHGIGNILRSITKMALPFLKKGASKVGKQALKTSMDIAGDAMQGRNIKKTIKRRMSEGLKDLVRQQGRGRRGPPGQRVTKRKHKVVQKRQKVKPAPKKQKGYKRKIPSVPSIISHPAKRRRTSKCDALS